MYVQATVVFVSMARLGSCWDEFGRVSKLYRKWVGRLVGVVGKDGVLGGLDGQVPGVVHGFLVIVMAESLVKGSWQVFRWRAREF